MFNGEEMFVRDNVFRGRCLVESNQPVQLKSEHWKRRQRRLSLLSFYPEKLIQLDVQHTKIDMYQIYFCAKPYKGNFF